jgi:hypothetical protein
MLDPIDSSIGSHNDEVNSGFIDLIDPTSDYLPDQLRFFPQSVQIKMQTMQYIRFTSYQDNCGFAKIRSMSQIDFASHQNNSKVLSLQKMHPISSTPIQIITQY